MNALLTRGRRAAAIVAGAVVATSLAVVPAATAQAQPESCLVVDYQVTSWSNTPDSGGFVVHVTLTNVCDHPVNGWTLALTLPPGQQLTGVWSANVAIAGNDYTFTPAGWNALIVPGGSAAFGFIGIWTGAYQDPLSCTVNGDPCFGGGGNQPPEVTLTSPEEDFADVVTCPVTFAAEAADPDGSVDRVEFYVTNALVGTVLVGTVEEAPYELEHRGNPILDGENTAFARAFDDGNPALSTDSEPVMFLMLPPPPGVPGGEDDCRSPIPPTPPDVFLTSPVEGGEYAGTAATPVPFAAQAFAYNAAIDRVEFYVNGVLVATDDTAPYEVDVDLSGTPGIHTINPDNEAFARAYDTREPSLVGQSATVSFTLLPPPPG